MKAAWIFHTGTSNKTLVRVFTAILCISFCCWWKGVSSIVGDLLTDAWLQCLNEFLGRYVGSDMVLNLLQICFYIFLVYFWCISDFVTGWMTMGKLCDYGKKRVVNICLVSPYEEGLDPSAWFFMGFAVVLCL